MEEKQSSFVTVLGGVEMVVHLQLEDGQLKEEKVKVRQLPVKLYPQFRAALRDEMALVAIYCNKDVAWAGQLDRASHERLITEGKKLNWDFFLRWVERQKEMEALAPKTNMEEIAMVIEAVGKSRPELLNRVFDGALAAKPGGAQTSATS